MKSLSVRRRLLTLLAFLMALAGFWPAAVGWAAPASTPSPVLVAVEVGWDGLGVDEAWMPVRVRLRGGEQDRTVRVEARPLSSLPVGARQSVEVPLGSYGVETALPSGVEKEFTLWVPAAAERQLEVRVWDGKTLLDHTRAPLRVGTVPHWPLIGVLAAESGLVQAAGQITVPVEGLPVPIKVAELTPADMPAHAAYLDAFGTLIVQGGAGAELTDSQRRALAHWVQAGGLLLITGGPDLAQDLGVLAEVPLPLQVTGLRTGVDLRPLATLAGLPSQGEEPAPELAPDRTGAFPVAVLEAHGGTVALQTPTPQGGLPLVWHHRMGAGQVTVLAADLAREPLASWPGRTALLESLIRPAMPLEPDRRGLPRSLWQTSARELAGLTRYLPPGAFPDWKQVGLLLAGYALVAGPLLYLILRRLRRPEWVWVAVPALALLVGGGLYTVGVGIQNRDVMANVVGSLVLDGQGGGRQDVAMGFFAPTHQNLTVNLPAAEAVQVSVRDRRYRDPVALLPREEELEPPYQVTQGRVVAVEFAAGRWEMRNVTFRRLRTDAGRIDADLTMAGGAISGTVTNATPYELEDAAVVLGMEVARLGTLAPGESREVRLDLHRIGQLEADHGPGVSWLLYGRPRPNAPATASDLWERYDSPPRDPRTQQRVQVVDGLLDAYGPYRSLPGLTFLAFTREPLPGATVAGMAVFPYHLTLVQQPLQLSLRPGAFALPPGLARGRLVERTTPGMGYSSTPGLTWVEIDSGYLTYEFTPPLDETARVEALTVTTRSISLPGRSPAGPGVPSTRGPGDPQAGPAQEGVFSLYNWQSARWEPLPAGQDQAEIRPAAPYLGPGRAVRVRASALPGQETQFMVPTVGFAGRVEP